MSNERSRVTKFNKRRRNTKLISNLLVIGSILAILLISVLLFSGSDNNKAADPELTSKTSTNEKATNEKMVIKEQTDNKESNTALEDKDEQPEQDEVKETEQVMTSDENVLEAYRADWQPIGTSQSEPHTVDYDANSRDREEMQRAIQLATGLDDMTVWWIGNDGDEKVVSTVSSLDNAKTYRVYLLWVTNRGWQPTLVEELKVNDKK